MTAPASFDRVLALLRRLSPVWPSTDDDTMVGLELRSIATALGLATDRLDTALDEIFPDTTDELAPRWEKVTRVATRRGDALSVRQARILSVLRRESGPRVDQLGKVLASILDLDVQELIFVEPLRSYITDALTQTTGVVAWAVPTTDPGLKFDLGKPWPGVVDGAGVSVYIALDAWTSAVATLTGPDGTVWTIPATATGWYSTRSVFLGKPAGGAWKFDIYDTGAPTLTETRLLVSNDIDSAQIYNFLVQRDPDLPGTPDLVEGQRVFHHVALGHMRAFVIERLSFICGDPHSLCGRDLIGA